MDGNRRHQAAGDKHDARQQLELSRGQLPPGQHRGKKYDRRGGQWEDPRGKYEMQPWLGRNHAQLRQEATSDQNRQQSAKRQ